MKVLLAIILIIYCFHSSETSHQLGQFQFQNACPGVDFSYFDNLPCSDTVLLSLIARELKVARLYGKQVDISLLDVIKREIKHSHVDNGSKTKCVETTTRGNVLVNCPSTPKPLLYCAGIVANPGAKHPCIIPIPKPVHVPIPSHVYKPLYTPQRPTTIRPIYVPQHPQRIHIRPSVVKPIYTPRPLPHIYVKPQVFRPVHTPRPPPKVYLRPSVVRPVYTPRIPLKINIRHPVIRPRPAPKIHIKTSIIKQVFTPRHPPKIYSRPLVVRPVHTPRPPAKIYLRPSVIRPVYTPKIHVRPSIIRPIYTPRTLPKIYLRPSVIKPIYIPSPPRTIRPIHRPVIKVVIPNLTPRPKPKLVVHLPVIHRPRVSTPKVATVNITKVVYEPCIIPEVLKRLLGNVNLNSNLNNNWNANGRPGPIVVPNRPHFPSGNGNLNRNTNLNANNNVNGGFTVRVPLTENILHHSIVPEQPLHLLTPGRALGGSLNGNTNSNNNYNLNRNHNSNGNGRIIVSTPEIITSIPRHASPLDTVLHGNGNLNSNTNLNKNLNHNNNGGHRAIMIDRPTRPLLVPSVLKVPGRIDGLVNGNDNVNSNLNKNRNVNVNQNGGFGRSRDHGVYGDLVTEISGLNDGIRFPVGGFEGSLKGLNGLAAGNYNGNTNLNKNKNMNVNRNGGHRVYGQMPSASIHVPIRTPEIALGGPVIGIGGPIGGIRGSNDGFYGNSNENLNQNLNKNVNKNRNVNANRNRGFGNSGVVYGQIPSTSFNVPVRHPANGYGVEIGGSIGRIRGSVDGFGNSGFGGLVAGNLNGNLNSNENLNSNKNINKNRNMNFNRNKGSRGSGGYEVYGQIPSAPIHIPRLDLDAGNFNGNSNLNSNENRNMNFNRNGGFRGSSVYEQIPSTSMRVPGNGFERIVTEFDGFRRSADGSVTENVNSNGNINKNENVDINQNEDHDDHGEMPSATIQEPVKTPVTAVEDLVTEVGGTAGSLDGLFTESTIENSNSKENINKNKNSNINQNGNLNV